MISDFEGNMYYICNGFFLTNRGGVCVMNKTHYYYGFCFQSIEKHRVVSIVSVNYNSALGLWTTMVFSRGCPSAHLTLPSEHCSAEVQCNRARSCEMQC